MEIPTQPPPEAKLIEELREAARPKLSVRKAAEAAGISEGRWRQISKGYNQATKDTRVPVRAPADTLARMARVVGATADQLLEVGRGDAADELSALAAPAKRPSSSTTATSVSDDEALAPLLAWERDKSRAPLETTVAAVGSLTRYLALVHKRPEELTKSEQKLVDYIEKLQARVLADSSDVATTVSREAAARSLSLANKLAAGVEALDRELDLATDETKRAISEILAVGVSLVTYSLDQPEPLDLDTSDPQQFLEQLRERQDHYAEVTLLFGAADRTIMRLIDIAGRTAAKPSPTTSEVTEYDDDFPTERLDQGEAGRVARIRARKRTQPPKPRLSIAQVALDTEALDYLGRVDELAPGANLRQELERRRDAIPDRASPAGYAAYLSLLRDIVDRALNQLNEQAIQDAATELIAEGEEFLATHRLVYAGRQDFAARATQPNAPKGVAEQGEASGEENQDLAASLDDTKSRDFGARLDSYTTPEAMGVDDRGHRRHKRG